MTMPVVIGIIYDNHQNLLISQRPQGAYYGGYWEFPGGKVENGESLTDALARELYEEVGIRVEKASQVIDFEYSYPTRDVHLHVWLINQYLGTPEGKEGQLVKWVKQVELSNYQFPEANYKILEAIQGVADTISTA